MQSEEKCSLEFGVQAQNVQRDSHSLYLYARGDTLSGMQTNVRGEIIYDCIFILLGIWQIVYLFGWVFLLSVHETCTSQDMFPMMPVWEHGVATVSIFSFVIAFIQYVAAETVFKPHAHESEGEKTPNETTKQENTGNDKNEESGKQTEEATLATPCNGVAHRLAQNNPGAPQQELPNLPNCQSVKLPNVPNYQSVKPNPQTGKPKDAPDTNQSQLKLDSFWILVMVLHFFWLIFGTVTIVPGFFTKELYDGVHTLNKKGCHSPSHFWFSFLCLCMEWIFLLQLVIMTKLYFSKKSLKSRDGSRENTVGRSMSF